MLNPWDIKIHVDWFHFAVKGQICMGSVCINPVHKNMRRPAVWIGFKFVDLGALRIGLVETESQVMDLEFKVESSPKSEASAGVGSEGYANLRSDLGTESNPRSWITISA